MDLNEIMHFLKRAVSFKTRDAGTVTWASERPAPRAPRRAPGIDGSGCFGGHASFGAPGPDARGSRGARAARSSLCSPAGFPSFRLRVSDATAAVTRLSGGRAPCRPAPRASESGASAPGG